MGRGRVIFGYQTVSGVPLCPCKDPGNYLMAEETKQLLIIRLRCWCGKIGKIKFESPEERKEWLAEQGVE